MMMLIYKYANVTDVVSNVVGTNVGDISIWEVGSRERLALKTFKVWDISACSMPFQVSIQCACLVLCIVQLLSYILFFVYIL